MKCFFLSVISFHCFAVTLDNLRRNKDEKPQCVFIGSAVAYVLWLQ